MNRTEKLIYLAGFIDGEGCLTTSKTNQNGRYRPQLRVASTDRPIVEWIKRWFGVNYYVNSPRTGQTKESYEWVLSTNQAIDLIRVLMPYLKIKKAEAVIFVSFCGVDVPTSQRLAGKLSALKRRGRGRVLAIGA